MAKLTTKDIRNLSIVGHSSSGKTSLAEALLYNSGAISRLGKVDNGTATTDYMPSETKRGISINTALAFCDWKGNRINIIDTPGYLDFTFDAQNSLKAVESALITVCGVSGVEVQTERMWAFAEKEEISRVFFINKMDRERVDFFRVVDEIRDKFGTSCVPIQIPIGKESEFKGIVDIVKMKAIIYDPSAKQDRFKEESLPEDLKAQAEEYREKLIESISELNDELLVKYLEGEELSESELLSALKKGILTGEISPILCGSATSNIGIEPLLDFIVEYLPSPVERTEIKVLSEDGSETVAHPDVNEPPVALVFKTVADPYMGTLSYFRVFSGILKSDMEIFNSTKKETEKLGKLFKLKGKEQVHQDEIIAGDIGVVAKLKNVSTGDTLCSKDNPVMFEPIEFPEPVISYAIYPKTKGDEDKLSGALSKMMEEDPTVRVYRNNDTGETILSAMGDSHVDIIIEELKEKFGVNVEKQTPKVAYKETIKKTVKSEGKYKKQSGGRGQYGHCFLEISPLPRGSGFEFESKIVGGVIPKQYIPAVEKGVIEAMKTGILAGYPVIDVKVVVYDGSYHPVDSSELAFKLAASMAFKKGAKDAMPVILEPIMELEVEIPKDYMGDVIGDLNSKRGRILGMEPKGSNQIIKALVPLAEIFKYAIDLRSLTQGRGMFRMKFSHYEEVPPQIAQTIIEQAKKEHEENS